VPYFHYGTIQKREINLSTLFPQQSKLQHAQITRTTNQPGITDKMQMMQKL